MSELTAIASDFRDLADRFNRSAAQCAKVKHIATNLRDNAGKAGRLLYRAIELGAFPKEHAKQNGQWWDTAVGRWPGGCLSVAANDERPAAQLMRKVSTAISGTKPTPADDADYLMGWTFAISSWLFKAFPARFRCKANEWDFAHVKTDERGRPCNREGKPLRYHLMVDDKPIPDNFLNESEYSALLRFPPPPMPPAIVERLDNAMPGWKRWGMKLDPVVMVEHEYDEADAMEHARIRCEVYADACKVLAELIEQAATADDATAATNRLERRPKLTPTVERVRDQWLKACEAFAPEVPKDREAYDWLTEVNTEAEHRSRPQPFATLDPFDNWARYLRKWRGATVQQRNKPRRGRVLARQSGQKSG